MHYWNTLLYIYCIILSHWLISQRLLYQLIIAVNNFVIWNDCYHVFVFCDYGTFCLVLSRTTGEGTREIYQVEVGNGWTYVRVSISERLGFFKLRLLDTQSYLGSLFIRAYHSYLRVEWAELPCCNQNYSVRFCWPSRFEITLNHHLRCPNLSNFNGFRLQRGFCCCIDSDFLISEWAR